tara:strand:+ start:1394 stop:2107 length:714 start_codon:yes stop_codon:yes gene_type:complete
MRNKEQLTVISREGGDVSYHCKCMGADNQIWKESTFTAPTYEEAKRKCAIFCRGKEASSTSSQKFNNFTSGLTGNRWFNAEGDGILLEEEEPNSDVDADSGMQDSSMPKMSLSNDVPMGYDPNFDLSQFGLPNENNPNHADFDPTLEGSKDNLGRVRRSSAEWDAYNRQSSGDQMAQGVRLGTGKGSRFTINGIQRKNTQGGNTPIIIQQAGFGKMSYILIGGALLLAAIIYSRKDK